MKFKKNILLALAALAVVILLGVSGKKMIAVDRCLDAGGSYNYEMHECDFKKSHPVSLRQLFFPPKDLYTPLVLTELDMSQPGASIESEFQHRYPRNHEMGIYLDNKLAPETKFKGKLKITITGSEGVVQERILEKSVGQFLGWSQQTSGITLWSYRTPDDLPIKSKLKIKVTVLSPDPVFAQQVGRTRFFVRKTSDK